MKEVQKYLLKVRHVFPSNLPVGMTEFNSFCESIFEVHGYPDLPSYRQMVASMILHLPPTTTKASKRWFASAINKAQSNEVAFNVIQDIKNLDNKADTPVELKAN